ncbi:MAG: glutamate-5-semialdehyde dehydrogenase [Treponema sp.]|jgi:glutamate-5-semialdehyde dehydrogenase|nr:glutamate-5-semialdehyde dehydrogenase [Treponema sp.]
MTIKETLLSLKKAQALLALQNRRRKDTALLAAAAAIDGARAAVLSANAGDVEKAKKSGMKDALIDRLFLDNRRIDSIIEGIKTVAGLEDPVGRVKAGWKAPNGLFIEELTVPLGVAAIIYESRPNVTADAASLAYKAGCAILLRGSSAALESNRAITAAIKQGLRSGGGIAEAVELAGSGDHGDVDEILTSRGLIDVVLPRGGHDLIRRVVENARVPVIETGEGNCHIFIDASADIPAAAAIVENAKICKPGACNAVETVLVHRDVLSAFMPVLAARLGGRVELRCDAPAKAAAGTAVKDAAEEDWETEFLDYILAVKTVDSLDQAVDHINRYGTRHSEAILTNNMQNAEAFTQRVDAACVYTNASTRFTDGAEFGFGAELGISTQKFHARGPMGLFALTTIKYRISGQGQVRE